jgi:hypothetical protein
VADLKRSTEKAPFMSRISHWEWHGSALVLILLCITGVLLPFGVVYFMTNLLKIEEDIADAATLSEHLEARRK